MIFQKFPRMMERDKRPNSKSRARLFKKVVSLTIRARMGSAPKRVLFKIIDEMRIYSSLKTLLHFSSLSRLGYYKWKIASQRADSEADITAHIKASIHCGHFMDIAA